MFLDTKTISILGILILYCLCSNILLFLIHENLLCNIFSKMLSSSLVPAKVEHVL